MRENYNDGGIDDVEDIAGDSIDYDQVKLEQQKAILDV